ncbi:MAG: hypothetical protein AB7S75_08745 [Desulfococcaceae bacterium]
MSYLKNIMQEEHQRLKALSEKYRVEIGSLPKGSISVKKRGQKKYLYLAYRQKKKVISEYIGPAESEHSETIIKKINIRKNYEIKLKQVKTDLKEIEKVLNGRKI